MRQLVDHFENRLFELATTLMMLGLSVHIALWPDAIGASAFHKLLEVLNEAWLGWGFAIAGTARFAALIANGHWKFYGPILRAGGALSGALIWFQMCISLYQLVPTLGSPGETVNWAYLLLGACLGMGPLVLRNGPGTLSTDKLKALITK